MSNGSARSSLNKGADKQFRCWTGGLVLTEQLVTPGSSCCSALIGPVYFG